MWNQKYMSGLTSINSHRLPSIFNKIDFKSISEDGKYPLCIVDYGCGKYYQETLKLLAKKFGDKIYFSYLPVDPVWAFTFFETLESEIWKWKKSFPKGKVVCVCSNVLNVIAEDNIIYGIKNRLFRISPLSYFSVYEGNKSGVGRETKKGCYQRNQIAMDYVDTSYFEHIRYGIICRDGGEKFIKSKVTY